MSKTKKIINRELSWLAFNHRVLQEAADPGVPLIERLRFLGIFSNNMDEFFKVRVASVKRMIGHEKEARRIIGEKPRNLMNRIQQTVIGLQKVFDKTYLEIVGQLEKENIFLINETQLSDKHRNFVEEYFESVILPNISPIMLRNVQEFPPLTDKSIYLVVILKRQKKHAAQTEYALIELPTDMASRFLVLPPEKNRKFIMILDDVIRTGLPRIFSIFNFDHFEAYTIKLTRDAELDIDNDISKSFLELISSSVSDRKKGQPVRFVYDKNIPRNLLDYLIREMDLDEEDNLIPGGRYHNFKDYMEFPNTGRTALEYSPTPPLIHPELFPGQSILEVMAQKDILLYYPYQKFSHFIDLLREASMDPAVKTIKICVYRVARVSKVTNALINAARNGKEVTVIIELRARFDEKSNIYWARKLEEAGVRVIFGVPGLKVHSKILQISRREGKSIRHYALVSTGNFHEQNAGVYSDLTLLTSDLRISQEVKKVFDFFENTFKTYTYKHLLVSPMNMRRRLITLIDKEIQHTHAGKPAYIILKINNLVDAEMIKKLYKASQAGVKIKLLIRGICCLVPGLPGISENIEARAIIDKFLEHSRIFIFSNLGKEKFYISSADWMPRNLDHRVEVATPVYDPLLQQQIRNYIDIQWSDNVKNRIINDSQSNPYVVRRPGENKIRAQIKLYEMIRDGSLSNES
ncbi:MAG: polyphosphate kinase 1 [Bacteroidales bacterium]